MEYKDEHKTWMSLSYNVICTFRIHKQGTHMLLSEDSFKFSTHSSKSLDNSAQNNYSQLLLANFPKRRPSQLTVHVDIHQFVTKLHYWSMLHQLHFNETGKYCRCFQILFLAVSGRKMEEYLVCKTKVIIIGNFSLFNSQYFNYD